MIADLNLGLPDSSDTTGYAALLEALIGSGVTNLVSTGGVTGSGDIIHDLAAKNTNAAGQVFCGNVIFTNLVERVKTPRFFNYLFQALNPSKPAVSESTDAPEPSNALTVTNAGPTPGASTGYRR